MPRTEWVLNWPGQVTIAGCQTYWTMEVAQALDAGNISSNLFPQLARQVGLKTIGALPTSQHPAPSSPRNAPLRRAWKRVKVRPEEQSRWDYSTSKRGGTSAGLWDRARRSLLFRSVRQPLGFSCAVPWATHDPRFLPRCRLRSQPRTPRRHRTPRRQGPRVCCVRSPLALALPPPRPCSPPPSLKSNRSPRI